MSKSNYQKIRDSSERPPKVKLEIHPFDPFAEPTKPPLQAENHASEESTSAQSTVGARPAMQPARAIAAERPMFLTPIDPSEKPTSVGHLMYPSRQEQLTDLEYIEHRKRWRIIEQALSEYVERHYGTKNGRVDPGRIHG
jgi:hypothetical protein